MINDDILHDVGRAAADHSEALGVEDAEFPLLMVEIAVISFHFMTEGIPASKQDEGFEILISAMRSYLAALQAEKEPAQ